MAGNLSFSELEKLGSFIVLFSNVGIMSIVFSACNLFIELSYPIFFVAA
jgi:hypothetical protein